MGDVWDEKEELGLTEKEELDPRHIDAVGKIMLASYPPTQISELKK